MAKGRKQYKTIASNGEIDQTQLLDMFQQLTGDPSKLDPNIVRDKYQRLKNDIIRCNKLLLKFKEAILDNLYTKRNVDACFDFQVEQLVEFVKRSSEYIDVEPENDQQMIAVYQALKDSFIIEEYLKVCKILRQNEDCVKDRCNLSDSFIKRSVGEDFYLFDFAKINFKHLFTHILEENFTDREELADCKRYILVMCNMFYITTGDIYTMVTSPDVDIDKLSELIIDAITAAKKQVPRCDKAFRLIENSVDMLKNGMSSYYKDFVASGNPAVIFENFINDISNDLHIDKSTLCQFKRIIFHFRKKANEMPKKNSKLDGVFTTLDKIMDIMDNDNTDKQ